MTLEDIINDLVKAANDGTLMTPKHDPKYLGTIFNSYRTVLSHELSKNLLEFLNSKNFTVIEYYNVKQPKSPKYIVITPLPNKGFDIPASGVTACSPIPTEALNCLIAVSGQTKGWHIFGENSMNVKLKIDKGDLKRK